MAQSSTPCTQYEVATDCFFTAHSGFSDITSSQSKVWVDEPFSLQSPDEVHVHEEPKGPEDELAGNGGGPQNTQESSLGRYC